MVMMTLRISKISLTELCHKKVEFLEGRGMEVVGVILAHRDDNGKIDRATVDNFGRVQWWDVDGSGKMVSSEEVRNG